MRTTTIFILALLLAGCGEYPVLDRCEQERIFYDCLMITKEAHPDEAFFNDASEVIDSCAKQAYTLALKLRGQVAKECR